MVPRSSGYAQGVFRVYPAQAGAVTRVWLLKFSRLSGGVVGIVVGDVFLRSVPPCVFIICVREPIVGDRGGSADCDCASCLYFLAQLYGAVDVVEFSLSPLS